VARKGKCALCLKDGKELQDSHFLPAGVYRVVRDETQGNPEPIKFDDEAVVQDSKQVSDHLLCSPCEQLFNRHGEDWFLRNCWRRKQFRLASILEAATAIVAFPRIKVFHAATLPKIDVHALTYFSVSMFWRASVHRWRMSGRTNKGIELGPYEEEVRKYLIGESDFPQRCALWVSLPDNITTIAQLSLTPYGGRKDTHHAYKLAVLGVGFHLFVGNKIPKENRDMCFVRGVGHPILKTDMLEEGILRDVHRKFALHPQLLKGPRGNR